MKRVIVNGMSLIPMAEFDFNPGDTIKVKRGKKEANVFVLKKFEDYTASIYCANVKTGKQVTYHFLNYVCHTRLLIIEKKSRFKTIRENARKKRNPRGLK